MRKLVPCLVKRLEHARPWLARFDTGGKAMKLPVLDDPAFDALWTARWGEGPSKTKNPSRVPRSDTHEPCLEDPMPDHENVLTD